MVIYITKEAVVRTNKGLVSIYGQPYTMLQEANLDYVLDRMQRYGEDIADEREKILKKAAYLLYHLAYDAHVFSDGNKRTALTSTLYFLLPNGYIMPDEMSAPGKQDEIAQLMKETAKGDRSVSFLYRWLDAHLIKIEII